MNLTHHIIRKDLRALRWPLLLWVAACLTHLGLRLAQLARGDAAELTPFWRRLETSDRWDHLAVIVLPILLIPLLLHLDPLRGALAFWKSVPISRRRLLTAKSATLLAFFIALPLACEIIYFVKAGLSTVLATALADWAWRFLPGIGAVVLGCLFTRSLRVGVLGVALALCTAIWMFQWPYGRDRIVHPLLTVAPAPLPGIIAPPPGARLGIEAKSVGFERTVFQQSANQREERLSVALNVHAAGMPADVLIRGVSFRANAIHLPGRTVSAGGAGRNPLAGLPDDMVVQSIRLQQNATPPARTASAAGANSNPFAFTGGSVLPAQEQRDDFGRSDGGFRSSDPTQWRVATEYLRFTAKDIAPAGALVEGTVHVALARRRTIATLPLDEGATWQPGLHRFALSRVSDPNALTAQFRGTLATILADPRGDTGGLALTPRTSFALWLEHTSLPYRKHLQFISSDAWRNGRAAQPAVVAFTGLFDPPFSGLTDITRSRRRTQIEQTFDPVAALRNGATPLQVARFSEEQAQVRNWRLTIVTYEDLGAIELPLKAVVPRPAIAREEERDDLPEPGPSLGKLLTELVVPPNPTREDARRILAQIADLAARRTEDSIRGHENALLQKIAALGPDNIDVLLTAVAEAAPAPPRFENPPRQRSVWLRSWPDPNPFWQRVRHVACDLARPADKALFLRHHAPRVDLLRAIEPYGWEDDALPAMCAMAAEEPVPPWWQQVFARHPGPLTQAALLAQIRLRAVSPGQLADLIASGALPPREAASALWETALANTGNIEDLTPAFPLAVKHGVEVMPRDLLRILRLGPNDWTGSGVTPFKTRQSAFVQSFALRSACPPSVAAAAPWLEENALALAFDDTTGRYELPGPVAPALDLRTWGGFTDPLGAGRAAVEDGALVLTAAGTRADYPSDAAGSSAPRVLREVEGDFTVEVTVHPAFDLAPEWARRGPQGYIYGRSETGVFESAGLLVQAGDHRWLRWEHGLWKNASGHELREETMRGGKTTVVQRGTEQWDRMKPLRLRISRHGYLFTTAWSQEGGAWIETPASRHTGWPRKVRVGPMVVSTVNRPFTARYTDYRLDLTSAEPTKLATPVEPHPGGEPTAPGTVIGEWGAVDNPIGAGIFTVNGGELSIDVAPKYADYNIQQRFSAPRVLREVEGDFTLEATIAPTPKKDWNSAGLQVSAGSDFYFNIGPAVAYGDKPQFNYGYAERGALSGVPNMDAKRDLTKPIRIRLQRRGWLLTISHQQDGGEWMTFYPLNLRHWPAKIQAGFVALNTSKEPFTARFSDLKFTRD